MASADHPGRQALARAVVSALGLSLALSAATVVPALASAVVPPRSELLLPAVLGLSIGLVAGPVALVELLFARLRPRLARDVAAALVAAPVAFASLILATLQFFSSFSFAQTGSWELGWKAVSDQAQVMHDHARDFGFVFGAAAIVFALGTATRLRRASLAHQTLALLIGTGLIALPFLRRVRRSPVMDLRQVGLWLVIAACVLPLAATVAEAIERRVLAWLHGDEVQRDELSGDELPGDARPESSAPALPSRRRALPALLWLVAVLALATSLGFRARQLLENPARGAVATSPLAESLLPAFAALQKGKLAPDEIAALVSRAFVLRYRVRPRLSPGTPLAMDAHTEVAFPSPFGLRATTSWTLDGEPLGSTEAESLSFGSGVLIARDDLVRIVREPRLEAGHHVLEGATTVEVHEGGPVVWSGTQKESLALDVAEGADEDAVQLVRPWLDEEAIAIDARAIAQAPRQWNLFCCVVRPEVAIVGRYEIRDEAGALLVSGEVGEGPDANGGPGGTAELAPGTHEVTLTIVPDARLAIEESATIREIYGEKIVRHRTVEVK